jgi:hypothetical protein
MRSQRTRPFWLRRDSARCQSRPTWNQKVPRRVLVQGQPYYRLCPRITACNHLPGSGLGSCIRNRSWAFTSFSFAFV